MSRLYIYSYKGKGSLNWELFYDDAKGIRKPLEEDLNPVSFDTED